MKFEAQLNAEFKKKQIANTERHKLETELESTKKALEDLKKEYSYLHDLKD